MKIKRTGWVNVYDSRNWVATLYETKEEADKKATKLRIACVPVEYVPVGNEFDDGKPSDEAEELHNTVREYMNNEMHKTISHDPASIRFPEPQSIDQQTVDALNRIADALWEIAKQMKEKSK